MTTRDRSGLLYAEVEAVLASEIAAGALPVASQLPEEESLIARFDVSRTTIRTAIRNLASRGLVEIRRGKGTFVAQPKITQELTELSGSVEDMRAMGRHPTARIVAANETVAHRPGSTTGTLAARIRRARLADRTAMSFDETYLPREIGEKIVTNDLETEPIFSLLEQRYNIPLVRFVTRLVRKTGTTK